MYDENFVNPPTSASYSIPITSPAYISADMSSAAIPVRSVPFSTCSAYSKYLFDASSANAAAATIAAPITATPPPPRAPTHPPPRRHRRVPRPDLPDHLLRPRRKFRPHPRQILRQQRPEARDIPLRLVAVRADVEQQVRCGIECHGRLNTPP